MNSSFVFGDESGLTIANFEEICTQKLHVRSIPMQMPRRISYLLGLKLYGVLTVDNFGTNIQKSFLRVFTNLESIGIQ